MANLLLIGQTQPEINYDTLHELGSSSDKDYPENINIESN